MTPEGFLAVVREELPEGYSVRTDDGLEVLRHPEEDAWYVIIRREVDNARALVIARPYHAEHLLRLNIRGVLEEFTDMEPA